MIPAKDRIAIGKYGPIALSRSDANRSIGHTFGWAGTGRQIIGRELFFPVIAFFQALSLDIGT